MKEQGDPLNVFRFQPLPEMAKPQCLVGVFAITEAPSRSSWSIQLTAINAQKGFKVRWQHTLSRSVGRERRSFILLRVDAVNGPNHPLIQLLFKSLFLWFCPVANNENWDLSPGKRDSMETQGWYARWVRSGEELTNEALFTQNLPEFLWLTLKTLGEVFIWIHRH